jgi:hypothetical protein
MAALGSLQPLVITIDDKTVTVEYQVIDSINDRKEVTILVKDIPRYEE